MEQEEVKNSELVTRIEIIKKDYTQKNEQFFAKN